MKSQSSLLRRLSTPSTPAVVLFVLTFGVAALMNPRLLSLVGLTNFFSSYLPLVLAAIAVSIIMIGGGIDLSIGSTMSLVNVVFITMITNGSAIAIAVIASIASGLIVGVVNALLVAWGRIPPLLATLGTMFVVSGICLTIMPVSSGSAPSEMVRVYASGVAYIPFAALAIVLAFILWGVFSRTNYVLRLFAVGGDQRSAYGSGLRVPRVLGLSYIIGSGVAAIGALALTANVATGGPNIADTITLSAVAAAVIGGVSLLGGSGSPIGAAFGAMFLGLISNLVLSSGVSSYFVSLATGAVVLAGIVFTSLFRSEIPFLRRKLGQQTAPADEMSHS